MDFIDKILELQEKQTMKRFTQSVFPALFLLATAYGQSTVNVSGNQPVNNQFVVGTGSYTNIQAAVTAAGTTGSVLIPVGYAGTDTFTNPNRIAVYDYRLGASIKGVIDVTDFGAKGDAQLNSKGTISVSSSTLTTSGSPTFTAKDVGKTIALPIGSAGTAVVTTITGYNSANSVTIGTAATVGCTGSCQVWWGTDSTSAINTANIAAGSVPTGTFTIPGGIRIYIPAGAYLTSSPLYVRGGEFFYGAGQTNTQIINVAARSTVVNVGENSSGTVDSSGLETGVYDLMMMAPFNGSGCLVNLVSVSGWDIENNNFESGGIGLCIPPGNTVGLVLGNTFDSNLFNDIQAVGNGSDPNNTNHSINIIGNMFFAPKYSAIELEGVTDFTIADNHFMYPKQYGMWGGKAVTSHRISILNNQFLTSIGSSYYASNQMHIYFATFGAGGLADSLISGNTFNRSRHSDIELDGSGTGGNTISNNQFYLSSGATTSGSPLASIYIPLTSSVPNRIFGNTWINPGGYAVESFGPIDAEFNSFAGTFNLSRVPTPNYMSGAVYTTGTIATPSVIRNNWTFDNTYPVFSDAGGAQTIYSSGNHSGFTTDEVNGAGALTTSDERVINISGTLAPVNFSAGVAVAGTAGFSGTKTAGNCVITIRGGIITNVTGC